MSEYILVSTTDRYRTVVENPNLQKVGEYEYHFFGKKKTTFFICRINNHEGARVVIQGVSEVFPDNSIPLKVFPKFDTIEEMEKEIYELDMDKDSKVIRVL
jgi:hypothetical protein